MKLIDYVPLALRTEKTLATPLARISHATLGLITEIGEITTEVKRMAIYEKPLDDARRAHIAEEIGDVMWYMAIAADALDYTLLEPVPRETQDFEGAVFNLAGYAGNFASYISWVGEPGAIEYPLTGMVQGIAQELADLAHLIGSDLATIGADNISKLRERFPLAFSNEAAEARADKGGLDARTS